MLNSEEKNLDSINDFDSKVSLDSSILDKEE